jgi:hypothetical protein
MTTTPSADRAAASRLVAALEHAWTAIRTHHPDVPQVVIVVASGSDPSSRRLNLGHFAAGRLRVLQSGLDAEDWVLWMLAGLAAAYLSPAVAFVQTRRQPAQAS